MTPDALTFLTLVLDAGRRKIARPRGPVQQPRTRPIIPVGQIGHTIDEMVQRLADPAWTAERVRACVLAWQAEGVVRRASYGGWRVDSLAEVEAALKRAVAA